MPAMAVVGLALGPAAGLHLSMLFPRPWELCRRLPWIQALPYLVTLVVYAGLVGQARPPAALAQPYVRD